ncbi:MAG: glycosyltransferase [Chloroflexota bacterium]|nr:glycosyltransferase [Chloroflexota bacterium]
MTVTNSTLNTRYLYVAYTLSLTLKAANAVQTLQTTRHLRDLAAAEGALLTVVVPRWLREPSRFAEVLGPNVRHLPRIPFNKGTRFWKTGALSYVERTAWSAQLLAWIGWQRLRGRGFAAIYVRDAVCAYWLLRAGRLTGAPLVYEVHDLEQTNPSGVQSAGWTRVRRTLDRVTIRRPAQLVSLTATFLDHLAAQGLRPAAEVSVIPDAYDDSLYTGTSQAAARAALALPATAFIVGYAGLTFAYRRLDLLVTAFAALRAQVDPARPCILILAGGRPAEQADLAAQARQLGLSVGRGPWAVGRDGLAVLGRQSSVGGGDDGVVRQHSTLNTQHSTLVLLPGQVDQAAVVQYLAAADVLVIPDTVTTLTASPLKLFEYMAAGRPIVLRELLALREILGDDGVYFLAGDAAALSAALAGLAADPTRAARLGQAAAARAVAYTYRTRAARVLAVLRSVQRH